MSRVGRMPILIPKGVKVNIKDHQVSVEGPLGTLTKELPLRISLTIKDNQIIVERPSDEREDRALHGLTRNLVAGMIEGVTKGFQKVLEIQGVGYRAQVEGKKLILTLGYTHPIIYEPPPGIQLKVEKQTQITVSGVDKHLVGEVAAVIRDFKRPEPYKGTGIRYGGEHVRRKVGKVAVGAAAGAK